MPVVVLAEVHAATLADNCLVRNDWICPLYLQTRAAELWDGTLQHLYITAVSLLIGVLISVPLAVFAHEWRKARPLTLGISTALYTIPSLAMFSLLLPFLGLSAATTITGLVVYSLTILVRNLLVGLDNVDDDVRDAARGMGFGRFGMLRKVEAPLAIPAAFAGLRVAAVSTIALTTVGALVGYGGLGNIMLRGVQANFKAEVLTSSVLCVVLAVLADFILLGLQHLVAPWQRTAAP